VVFRPDELEGDPPFHPMFAGAAASCLTEPTLSFRSITR
jgi:hypothetical protein